VAIRTLRGRSRQTAQNSARHGVEDSSRRAVVVRGSPAEAVRTVPGQSPAVYGLRAHYSPYFDHFGDVTEMVLDGLDGSDSRAALRSQIVTLEALILSLPEINDLPIFSDIAHCVVVATSRRFPR
jgi:hypothetical protein